MYNNDSNSLNAGAPDIRLSGNQQMAMSDPSPGSELFQMYQNALQSGQIPQGTTFEMFKELLQQSRAPQQNSGIMAAAPRGTYTQNRKDNMMAYGGIAGADGRKKYGIGSFFQKAKDKFVDDIIPNEIKENPLATAALIGGGLNQFGLPDFLPDVGVFDDDFGKNWLGNLLGKIPGVPDDLNLVLRDDIGFTGGIAPGDFGFEDAKALASRGLSSDAINKVLEFTNANKNRGTGIMDMFSSALSPYLGEKGDRRVNPLYPLGIGAAVGKYVEGLPKDTLPMDTTSMNPEAIATAARGTDEEGAAAGLRFLPEQVTRAAEGGRIGYRDGIGPNQGSPGIMSQAITDTEVEDAFGMTVDQERAITDQQVEDAFGISVDDAAPVDKKKLKDLFRRLTEPREMAKYKNLLGELPTGEEKIVTPPLGKIDEDEAMTPLSDQSKFQNLMMLVQMFQDQGMEIADALKAAEAHFGSEGFGRAEGGRIGYAKGEKVDSSETRQLLDIIRRLLKQRQGEGITTLIRKGRKGREGELFTPDRNPYDGRERSAPINPNNPFARQYKGPKLAPMPKTEFSEDFFGDPGIYREPNRTNLERLLDNTPMFSQGGRIGYRYGSPHADDVRNRDTITQLERKADLMIKAGIAKDMNEAINMLLENKQGIEPPIREPFYPDQREGMEPIREPFNPNDSQWENLKPELYAQGGRIGAQEGGLMNLGGMEKDYRNEGGFVALGGKEKADDVPARLSKNEFVFTADAVRGAGGGDIDQGAEIMENMMKHLEAGGEVSEDSQGLEGARGMFANAQKLQNRIV